MTLQELRHPVASLSATLDVLTAKADQILALSDQILATLGAMSGEAGQERASEPGDD